MIKSFSLIGSVVMATALMTGCASGPKYAEVAKSIPTLKADQGRVFFLRSSSAFGVALRPDIRLNNEVVGTSQAGGFFYVDRPAGRYVAATSTETENTLSFVLDAGEVKYVRTSTSLGFLAGHMVPTLETPAVAEKELPELSYIGTPAAK